MQRHLWGNRFRATFEFCVQAVDFYLLRQNCHSFFSVSNLHTTDIQLHPRVPFISIRENLLLGTIVNCHNLVARKWRPTEAARAILEQCTIGGFLQSWILPV